MLQSFNTNLERVGYDFIKSLKVKITKESFKDCLLKNPYYPSIYSISKTLDYFNIPNSSLEVDYNYLKGLKPPFLAYFSGPNGIDDFISVKKMGDYVEFTIDGKSNNRLKFEDFIISFKNIVLVCEPNDKSGESSYSVKKKQELFQNRKKIFLKILLLICIITPIARFLFNSGTSIQNIAICVIIVLGLAVGYLLVAFEIDKSNFFAAKICSSGGSKTNCDAVLESKKSKFFGIRWSEIGFLYFLGLFIYIFFTNDVLHNKIQNSSLLFFASISFVPFSFYFQAKIIKQWCRLCITFQVILMIAFTWAVIYFDGDFKNLDFSYESISSFALSFLFPGTLWFLVNEKLFKWQDLNKSDISKTRALFNPDFFEHILKSQPQASKNWDKLGIILGDRNATTIITKVCNPYCNPCADIHGKLASLVKMNSNIVVRIIFTSKEDIHDESNNVAKHLLAIASTKDENATEIAIDAWYSSPEKNYNDFATKYPVNVNINDFDDNLKEMKRWCKDFDITYTPTIFVNGYLLPETYSVDDLIFVLN